jgi:hypothetical protein
MISELYAALKAAGVADDLARAAAEAVIGREERDTLATKTDIAMLRTDLAELKAELIKWNVGTLVALAAILSAIVKLT